MDPRPVGVFDSGAGGLTVLHECLVTLPHEDFLYLGDGARLPYGPRPLHEIRRFAAEIAGYLENQGVKLIVAACNAATSAALPELQERLEAPIVGVITPEAHAAVQATRNRRVGLLATEATVASGRYAELVRIFERELGRDITLVFSADETAHEVAETLRRKRIENDPARDGSCRFLTTGDPEAFRNLGERFLQLPIAEVERVTLAELEAAAA